MHEQQTRVKEREREIVNRAKPTHHHTVHTVLCTLLGEC